MSTRTAGSVSESLLDRVPVIPVVVVEDPGSAVPLARALVAGGVPVIELTLRTPSALEAIARIAHEVPQILVGAGTVLSAEQVEQAVGAGAQFLVSPGSTTALVDAMAASGLPHLPGVATVSEVLGLLERGYSEMKLFPAETAGGPAFLRALASPLPQVRFCPTGGVNPLNAGAYLSLPNVGCVGGSWLTPTDALAGGDWDRVVALARATAALRT